MNYRKELLENMLPFWLDHAIDRENGGIYTCLDREGNIYGTDKSVWFQGRALWAFCKAYNMIEKDPAFLSAAKCIYDFLPKCVDTDGRMYFTVTADGRGLQKRRYYFSETFAAIGCAEYAKATGDREVMENAEHYFAIAHDCFTGKIKTQPRINPQNQPLKALGPAMIMLSTAQVMQTLPTPRADEYRAIAEECLNEILHGGYLTERGLLENVSLDGGFVDTPTGRTVNPGHSFEAAWFIMSQGLLSGNDETLQYGKKIIDRTLPIGWDKARGGVISFTDVAGKPPMQLEWDMKLWWPQSEAMIALRMAERVFGEPRYGEVYREVEEYCKKYFIDAEYGEWYGYLHYDNTPSTDLKGNFFKGPFHLPRLYMIMALMDEGKGVEAFLQ